MGNYRIYPLHLGTIRRPKSNMTFGKDHDIPLDLPILAWYVTDGQHKLLVDTGGTPPDRRYQPYERTEDQSLPAALRRLGVAPEEITQVVLTHLHWDHAGGNQYLPNATFYAQRTELDYAAAPLASHRGSYDHRLVFQTAYQALDGCHLITEGISVLPTPGHSPGSQSIRVETEDGVYLLVGDLVGLYECVACEPMIPNALHTDLEIYNVSLNLVTSMGCKLLPGHDLLVLSHPCYPPKG